MRRATTLLVLLTLPATVARGQSELPPAENGFDLFAEQAAAGWISLFDGKTPFGWTGAKVERGILIGGITTTVFGDFDLRAEVARAGAIKVGARRYEAPVGTLRLQVRGEAAPIELQRGAAVRAITIRPRGLETILGINNERNWKRVDRPNLPPEKRPKWEWHDGVLSAVGGPGAMEYTGGMLGDFVLQIDVRTRARYANGGVFFRNQPGTCMMGYEAQIYNRCENNDPARPARYSTGAIDDRQLARRLVSRDDETFTMTVVAHGPHIATWVNGYQMTDWTDRRAPHENPRQGLRLAPGTLQLQAHDPATDVAFRRIRVGGLKPPE